ncbi:MAG: tRNA pseudouridine(55) synthase TruB [Patescibacteria group bacterium]|nr:tRNA pseudouridine(55) synthase TruB [Patescibacteria group bacterium]
MKGIAILYKEKGQTSYDVIREIKKRLDVKKIGHGGTLDPLAQGVLIIGIEKEGTKQLFSFLKGKQKEYIATIILGATSNTYDADGKITPSSTDMPSKKTVIEILKQFKGEFLQTPPSFSAVKISGKPAYKLARAGKEVKIEAKKVFVSKIELLDYNAPEIKLKLEVKSGFYVRSLANDLGKILKTGAYLKELTRTRVGKFTINEAIKIKDLDSDFLELYFKASGKVQGVFFRNSSRKWARKLNLTGKAENLSNNQIEIIVQGKDKNLEIFLEKIKKGPLLARVDSYNYYFRKPQSKYLKFSIL